MDLFDYMQETEMKREAPLASRMRPERLEEVVGQKHIIGKDRLLYRAIKADKLGSVIFYGPPGTGKTTLARVIANTTSARFEQINATTAGKKDMEEVVKGAKDALGMYGKKTILFVDEIHRFNKSQQDYLLPYVEDGTITRALEVYEQTGMTLDAFTRLHKRPGPKYQALKIAVCPAERQTLYDRIDRRVDQMLEDGLLDETRRLLDAGALAGTAAQAIGYKELLGYLLEGQPLDECVALLKQRSRNYAKRQLTWLKRDDKIHWIYYNKGEELPSILQEATKYLQNHGVQ